MHGETLKNGGSVLSAGLCNISFVKHLLKMVKKGDRNM
jgi:hypothetical protein